MVRIFVSTNRKKFTVRKNYTKLIILTIVDGKNNLLQSVHR